MKLNVQSSRSTTLLRYKTPDGKDWIRFLKASNTDYTLELPDDTVLLDYLTGEPMKIQPQK